MARIVPVGIDFWASRRSPDRFEPAMIPVGRRAVQIVARTTEEMTHIGVGGPVPHMLPLLRFLHLNNQILLR